MLDRFTPCFIQHFILMTSFRVFELRILNDLTKLKRNKKNNTHQIKMSLISSKEDSDHLSKLQEQNGEEYKDAAEEVEDSGKRKGKQIKESIPRKQKKRKVKETYPLSRFTSAWLFIIKLYNL